MRARAGRGTLMLLIALAAGALESIPASAVTLTGGKKVVLRNPFGTARDSALIRIVRDEALVSAPLPDCPNASSVRIGANTKTNDETELPCFRWTTRGLTSSYRDSLGTAGGVRSIVLNRRSGRLSATFKGGSYSNIAGPGAMNRIDFQLTIGTTRYCARFKFLRQSADLVVGVGPTVACGACGDGAVDFQEQCDDRNLVSGDGCDSNCTVTACGNGIRTGAEQCDDGNAASGDGCRVNCSLERCGDSIVDAGEQCDDGGTTTGDCCGVTCRLDPANTACTADTNECTRDVCNGAGACTHPASAAGTTCSEDGNLCTDDLCNGAGACVAVPNAASCDDGSHCTTGDVCAGGTCGGTRVDPWINELDYDGGASGATPDQDEFVEIAAPAGTDLGGYRLLAVEGNGLCATGTALTGGANLTATIPAGTVVGDPEETGIGFLVACFQNTSANQSSCDVVLPALDPLDNLRDGDPLNALPAGTCPDGVLLLDPLGGFVDAVSYEGQVPASGTYGAAFHVTPYDLGRDLGAKMGVSFEKRSSAFARATSASEWRLSGGCVDGGEADTGCVTASNTAGSSNPEQAFQCANQVCGNGIVEGFEDCDAGEDNSDQPDAACRPDCTAQRCGDDVVDPGAGEQCEMDADCPGDQFCAGCGCFTDFDFTVVPGPGAGVPPDDGQSTLLKITPLFGVENATNGMFNPGPLNLARLDPPRPDGKAELLLTQAVHIGAQDALGGKVCFRIEQDPDNVGEIDCDGGTNYDVSISLNSNGTGANGAPVLTIGGGSSDSGAGAGVVRVLLYPARGDDGGVACEDLPYTAPPTRTAFTTATARAEITNTRQGGDTVVTLSAQPFDCANWTSDSGASIAAPNVTPDFVLPLGLGTQDVSQVLRLNDD